MFLAKRCTIWLNAGHISDDNDASRPSDTSLLQETRSPLFHIIVWCRGGNKLIFAPMVVFCKLEHWELIAAKLKSKDDSVLNRKVMWKLGQLYGKYDKPFHLWLDVIGNLIQAGWPCISLLLTWREKYYLHIIGQTGAISNPHTAEWRDKNWWRCITEEKVSRCLLWWH